MIEAWRIDRSIYEKTSFTGEGARLYGGRWNSPGTPVVYLAESRALAMLEILVHISHPLGYVLYSVLFDESLVVEASRLPPGWDGEPPGPGPQRFGDDWVESQKSVVLAVPSAVVPEERNYLFNSRHPDSIQVKIAGPFACRFDPRLMRG